MTPFLLFTLDAPLMSFGEIAVGEVRGSWRRPSKSAVLGLVGAALGLDRADPVWDEMDSAYGFALRVDREGRLLTDYHTVQSAPIERKRAVATRRELLSSPHVGAMITRRDYLSDALFTVALCTRKDAPYSFERIAQALEQPVYALYVGRKSCPLGAPPAPLVVESETLCEAFAAYDSWARGKRDHKKEGAARREDRPSRRIAFDATLPKDLLGGLAGEQIYSRRRDRIDARKRWQFGLRDEIEARFTEPPA